MSCGVILFAFNNEKTDYVKLANASAIRILKWLDLPTTVVTDNPVTFENCFDNVIIIDKPNYGTRVFSDYDARVNWYNFNRYKAYELSPYDRTLLLDADYIVSSNDLKKLFDTNNSFLCHRNAFNLVDESLTVSNYFGLFNMPMFWATVVYFKKDIVAKSIFDSMKMIQNNYEHYSNLYQFTKHPYRNDYALSIALNINSGHFINSKEYTIPWDLASVVPENKIVKINENSFEVFYKDNLRVIVKDKDLHIMGKKYLEEIYEI